MENLVTELRQDLFSEGKGGIGIEIGAKAIMHNCGVGSNPTTQANLDSTSTTAFTFGTLPGLRAASKASDSEEILPVSNFPYPEYVPEQDSKQELPVFSASSIGKIKERCNLVSYEWTIPNFLSQKSFSLQSPNFSFRNYSWNLRLKSFSSKYAEQWYSIYLFLENTIDKDVNEKDLVVTFAVKLRGEWVLNYKETFVFHSEKPVFCCKKEFLRLANIEKRKSEFLPSGALTIACSMQERRRDSPEVKVKCMETLSFELKNLFLSKTQSDVTIKVKDAEFQAHKAILVARSSVFASTFEHDMREKETGVINIEDCDSSSFGDFLMYLYIGEIGDISLKSACSLYVTADKYNVQELKSCCVGFMKRDLAVENVCTVIALADQFEETSLLAAAETYFCRNYSEVLSTAEWELLLKTNYRLANKVLKKVVSRDESSKGMFSFGGFGKYPMF